MEFDDRVSWLLLGCALGFVLGYISRTLQDIKSEVEVSVHDVQDIKEEVEEIVTAIKRERNEDGFMRRPWAANFLMLSVLSLCVWASFSTNSTNNKLEDAVVDIQSVQDQDQMQDARLERISQCTLEFTSKTILALNQRTTYTQAQADSNVEVLAAQAEFLKIVLIIPPVSRTETRAALESYVAALAKFNAIAEKSKVKTKTYAYPTNEELADCLGVTLPDVETGVKEKE